MRKARNPSAPAVAAIPYNFCDFISLTSSGSSQFPSGLVFSMMKFRGIFSSKSPICWGTSVVVCWYLCSDSSKTSRAISAWPASFPVILALTTIPSELKIPSTCHKISVFFPSGYVTTVSRSVDGFSGERDLTVSSSSTLSSSEISWKNFFPMRSVAGVAYNAP
ncbi:MAG: hypothetical protein BWY05_01208 [Euryarchaeota archaeon ADurb.Bin165]|nr:MAG: hypothetical protein BWY05_01208 [Euryarchaeota archaeon ADurb.Bin165]